MSIPIGFFDFYSFMLPGILYLLAFNEATRVMKIGYFDLFLLKDNLWFGIGILLLAYIVGHIMDEVSFYWFRLLHVRRGAKYAYAEFKKQRMPNINFAPESWTILLGVIRRSDPNIAEKIELQMVNSIMLRNISFGCILVFIIQILSFVTLGISPLQVVIAIISLTGSGIALRQSVNHDRWFFEAVFEHAVTFGNTTDEVVNSLKSEKTIQASHKRKSKSNV